MLSGTFANSLAKFFKYSAVSVSFGKVMNPEFKENTHRFTFLSSWGGKGGCLI